MILEKNEKPIDFEKKKENLLKDYLLKLKNYKQTQNYLINSYVDCFDSSSVWRVAKIQNIQGNDITLNFDGWSHKWDEVLFLIIYTKIKTFIFFHSIL